MKEKKVKKKKKRYNKDDLSVKFMNALLKWRYNVENIWQSITSLSLLWEQDCSPTFKTNIIKNYTEVRRNNLILLCLHW